MVAAGGRRAALAGQVGRLTQELAGANEAREIGLAASRRVIRASSRAIRATHRLEPEQAAALRAEAADALHEASTALAPYPAVRHAGFLHDAAKEYAEACLTAALVAGEPLPDAADLGVDPPAWLNGLAEAASELRRHLLDRLRAGELGRGEELLAAMDDAYDALVAVDLPDALTGGLRRTVDALRAVLERTRGDVTTTVLQARLQRSLEEHRPPAPG